ncbi:MAG: sigma 54-interacting transcriptional regulator [Myxococcota bacterium]
MKGTVPLRGEPRIEVQTLKVGVLEGPDEGMTHAAQSEYLTVGSARGNDLVVNDPSVSGYHLELRCGPGGVEVHDLGSTNGTRLGNARIHHAVVPLGSVLKVGRTKLQLSDGGGVSIELHQGAPPIEMVGETAAMRRLMAQITKAAPSGVPTLLTGESGTGKEVVARVVHALGERPEGPFVTVDCGAFAPNLVASELFGHERGAFTGADRRHVGAFERADGGVLFLDEIGELPIELQPQLLGVLERQRFRRLGGQEEVSVDVRVVSATNRDLRQEVNQGRFRLDLYYRLAVVELRLPPLRERPEDIPALVEHFVRECGHAGPVEDVIDGEMMRVLLKHPWPGNVRELRNWVEATMAMGEASELRAGRLGPEESAAPEAVSPRLLGLPYKEARAMVLEAFEQRYLEHLIQNSEGNVSRAARDARMDRSYLIKLLQRHGLK